MKLSERIEANALRALDFTDEEIVVPLSIVKDEVAQLEAENELLKQLVLLHGHLPSCPQFTGSYDLGELEPVCTCGFDNVKLSRTE